MIDMHCHLLPRVDDGASSLREAIHLLAEERKQGVRKVIVTPHVRADYFETPDDVMRQQFEVLRAKSQELDVGVELYYGCEFHRRSTMVEELRQGVHPTLAGSRYVLVEFSHRDRYERIRQTIYDLVAAGYYPIIAHVERYPAVARKPDLVEELLQLGARMQVTAGAVYGQHGFALQWTCKRLLREDLVQFIGSDAHNMQHRRPDLQACAHYLTKKKGKSYVRKVLEDHPEMILENRYLKYE